MNNNRDLFTGNLTAEPELNCPPKGTRKTLDWEVLATEAFVGECDCWCESDFASARYNEGR